MAKRAAAPPRITVLGTWKLLTPPAARRRGAAAKGVDDIARALQQTGRLEAVSSGVAGLAGRRGVEPQPFELAVTPRDAALYVLVARHASGAITLHAPAESTRRRARAPRSAPSLRFQVATQSPAPGAERRGVIGRIISFVVMKVIGRLVEGTLEKLVAVWERESWRKARRPRGLLHVEWDGVGGVRLAPAAPRHFRAGERHLLFIHGTFSHYDGTYRHLATTRDIAGRTLLERARETYGERIFAFNHFTMCESPLENARTLLAALPAGARQFDVVTHSRGALVVRSLLERTAELGAITERFRAGSIVLVAGPNEGTPLSSPERWAQLTNWIVNLVDLFPDNPLTTAVEFAAEAIGWLARRLPGVVPGIAAMTPGGETIAALQAPPLPAGRFSALVANYEPDRDIRGRIADLGIDAFFQMDNDLVVPTAGGWTLGPNDDGQLPGDRIGFFGPGGNLMATRGHPVHHCNFFEQPESIGFLWESLAGLPHRLRPIRSEATTSVDGRRRVIEPGRAPGADGRRRTGSGGVLPEAGRPEMAARREDASAGPSAGAYQLDEILNLLVLVPDVPTLTGSGRDDHAEMARRAAREGRFKEAVLIASFRNARVYEPFRTKFGAAGQTWQKLIGMQRQLRGYVDGDPKFNSLPSDQELREFGALLFSTILPGRVRRLYDNARSEVRGRRIDICLTSTIPWVADMPWEFAFDPNRQMFLCLEEVNFLRNISTAVPAESLVPRGHRLRILIVAAQPIGSGALSADEERRVIRRGFEGLERQGAVEIDVEVGVTPEGLHAILSRADIGRDPYDILHFIGHGEFDRQSGFGYLIFEDTEGRVNRLRADVFRQIVGRRGIRVVFLNACETGTGYRSELPFDFSQGVAPTLIAGGLPAVVANQFKVLDPSATSFARHFYQELAAGRTLGDAAREARVAVNYSISGEAIDWAVPVLFARNPADRLAPRSAPAEGLGSAREAAAGVPGVVRRTAVDRRHSRVGIWDVGLSIPGLDEIVGAMNGCQSYFLFESIDLPAPLGTWRRSRTTQDGKTYLHAEDVEAKLHPALERLGVDHLFSVTNLPLADGPEKNLSSYVGLDSQISICSTSGLLERLDPPKWTIEGLLICHLVFSLSSVQAHRGGPKNCPSYYNEELDMRWMAGPIKICAACRRKIPRPVLAALDALARLHSE